MGGKSTINHPLSIAFCMFTRGYHLAEFAPKGRLQASLLRDSRLVPAAGTPFVGSIPHKKMGGINKPLLAVYRCLPWFKPGL